MAVGFTRTKTYRLSPLRSVFQVPPRGLVTLLGAFLPDADMERRSMRFHCLERSGNRQNIQAGHG